MNSGTKVPTTSGGGSSCAFLALEPLEDSARTVAILSMCDTFTTYGVETVLLMYPPSDVETPSADQLRQRYGLNETPRISWVPYDENRGA